MNKIPRSRSENTSQSQAGYSGSVHRSNLVLLSTVPTHPVSLSPSVTQSCTERKGFKSFLPCSGRLGLCSLTQGSSPARGFTGYMVPLFSLPVSLIIAQLIALLIDKVLCVSLKGERKGKSQHPGLQKQSLNRAHEAAQMIRK